MLHQTKEGDITGDKNSIAFHHVESTENMLSFANQGHYI